MPKHILKSRFDFNLKGAYGTRNNKIKDSEKTTRLSPNSKIGVIANKLAAFITI